MRLLDQLRARVVGVTLLAGACAAPQATSAKPPSVTIAAPDPTPAPPAPAPEPMVTAEPPPRPPPPDFPSGFPPPSPASSPFDTALARLRPALRRCYQRELEGDPSANGRVSVTKLPSSNPCSLKVKVTGEGTLSPRLLGCLRTTIEQMDICDDGHASFQIPTTFTL